MLVFPFDLPLELLLDLRLDVFGALGAQALGEVVIELGQLGGLGLLENKAQEHLPPSKNLVGVMRGNGDLCLERGAIVGAGF